MKRNKLLSILGILLIIIGFFMIVFPKMKNYFYEANVLEEKQILIERINNDEEFRHISDELYEVLIQRNEELYLNHQSGLNDPFSYAEAEIDLTEYDIDNNIIGYITIPVMNVQIPIYLGANKENLNKGVVHLTETSYPIGGNNTNSVLAAHRGHSTLKLFRDIEKLNLGDYIYIQNFREELTYEVFDIKIIDPEEVDQLLIREDEDMISLITCHPKYVDNKRYVVYARRVN